MHIPNYSVQQHIQVVKRLALLFTTPLSNLHFPEKMCQKRIVGSAQWQKTLMTLLLGFALGIMPGLLYAGTDNDGVPDATDIDDDNDGILDTVECVVAGPPPSLASNTPITNQIPVLTPQGSSVTINGINITSTNVSGSVAQYGSSYTSPSGITLPAGPLWLGNGGAFSYTISFDSPVEYMDMALSLIHI